jgi:hypothetical protein
MQELAQSFATLGLFESGFEKRGRSKTIPGGVVVKRGLYGSKFLLASDELYQNSLPWKSQWFVLFL